MNFQSLENNCHVEAVIYATPEFYEEYLTDQLIEYPLIGSLIPKKQSVSVIPIVTHDDQRGTMGGLFLSKEF